MAEQAAARLRVSTLPFRGIVRYLRDGAEIGRYGRAAGRLTLRNGRGFAVCFTGRSVELRDADGTVHARLLSGGADGLSIALDRRLYRLERSRSMLHGEVRLFLGERPVMRHRQPVLFGAGRIAFAEGVPAEEQAVLACLTGVVHEMPDAHEVLHRRWLGGG